MPRPDATDQAAELQQLEQWSRVHACAMLAASVFSLAAGHAWPAAVTGALSLGVCSVAQRGRWTPGGALGAANILTALRLLLIAALVPLCANPPGPTAALLVLAVFALDGLDGYVARRRNEASPFGACFDMESDALLVLLCALILYQHGRLGAFILVPGLLRYGYVLVLTLAPEGRGEAPRSRIGRYAFSVMVTSFVVSLWPVPYVHVPLAVAASLLIAYSFGRSITWSLRALPRAPAPGAR